MEGTSSPEPDRPSCPHPSHDVAVDPTTGRPYPSALTITYRRIAEAILLGALCQPQQVTRTVEELLPVGCCKPCTRTTIAVLALAARDHLLRYAHPQDVEASLRHRLLDLAARDAHGAPHRREPTP